MKVTQSSEILATYRHQIRHVTRIPTPELFSLWQSPTAFPCQVGQAAEIKTCCYGCVELQLIEKIDGRVDEDINPHRSCAKKGAPPPLMILRIQLTISDEDWNFQTFKHQHQKRHGKETEERVVGMLPDRKNGIEEFREPKWNQPPWAPHHSSSRRPIHTQTHMFHNEAPLTLWNWEVSMGTFCQCPAKLTEMLATKTDTATSRNTAPAQKGHLQPPIATCYCYYIYCYYCYMLLPLIRLLLLLLLLLLSTTVYRKFDH